MMGSTNWCQRAEPAAQVLHQISCYSITAGVPKSTKMLLTPYVLTGVIHAAVLRCSHI